MKKLAVIASAVLMVIGVGIVVAEDAQPAGKDATAQTVKNQTVCPVMGGKIDKKSFADYDGKRVYFCCGGCSGAFNKDPAKYIKKLEDQGVVLEKTPVKTDEKAAAKSETKDTAKTTDESCQKGGCGGCCE